MKLVPYDGFIRGLLRDNLQFVRWSEEDQAYVGFCPDLFPAGGVCHGTTPVEAFTRLSDIVEDLVSTALAQNLPLPITRPVREVEELV